MKKLIFISTALFLGLNFISCEKETTPQTDVQDRMLVNNTRLDNNLENVDLKSMDSTGYAYRTSIGMVVYINDLSEIEIIERDIAQMTQDEIEIELAKLKYQSQSCTTANGKRGLKCVSVKKGDCKNSFDCIQAEDGGDY